MTMPKADSGLPRGTPRGLIEASPPAPCRRSRQSRLPRGTPRGLIEALNSPLPSAGSRLGFRGVRPAASLKLAHLVAEGDPRDAGLPRGTPRGLIEARSTGSSSPRAPTGFRGVRPAASLKRPSDEQVPGAVPRLPRGTPRGLIEADEPAGH